MASSQLQSQARIPLSAQELRDISLDISREFAPRRFRVGAFKAASTGFSPQELLSISQQISREFAPRAAASRGAAKLVALPIDPEHLHVYWQLDEQPKLPPPTAAAPTDNDQPLTLRVFSQAPASVPVESAPEPTTAPAPAWASTPTWFDVSADPNRSQQQITLPDGAACMAGIYQVAIGRLNEHQEFKALAYSSSAASPRHIPAIEERLSPTMAAFIMLPPQASSMLAANTSGQHN